MKAPAVQAQLRPRSVPTSPGPGTRWFLWAGWPVALAASALLATTLLHQRDQEADTIVAAHVRSLLANHLSDVESTSHHTVKPWFAGKIDFSPPVPDLSGLGFELIGGRLDYLEHRPVAAVVYRKHGHVINVLVSRPGGDLGALPHIARDQGYTLRSWKQGGLDIVAISDIDPSELATLQQGYEAPAPLTSEPPNTP
jgi:anti-sigma factor RsiW